MYGYNVSRCKNNEIEYQIGGRGRLKNWGGGGEGLDWCMIKAGVRYTRIPDPAHVLSARGGQGGRMKSR